MRGSRNSNVEVLGTCNLEWKHSLLTGLKKKQKWRKSFVIFMFIANNYIFNPIWTGVFAKYLRNGFTALHETL